MDMKEEKYAVVAIRYQSEIRWFRSKRDLWVLDINKWRNEFIAYGYEVPKFQDSYRFGIHVINQETVQIFLDCMSTFEVHKDALSLELEKRFTTTQSWWDVSDLFPIMFVNFDDQTVGAFYPDGIPMERYVPDDWNGEFIDFANDYPEDIFPIADKFWVKNNLDLLKILNERGTNNN